MPRISSADSCLAIFEYRTDCRKLLASLCGLTAALPKPKAIANLVFIVPASDDASATGMMIRSSALSRRILPLSITFRQTCVALKVGVRIVELQTRLAGRVRELEGALEHVRQLQGILPICSYCKKIRGDQDYWQTVESYIAEHSEAEFSHGICPNCYETTVKDQLASFRALVQPVA